MKMAAKFVLGRTLERHGIKQSHLAKEARLSFATINRLCTDATDQVALKTLDKILKALAKRDIKATLDDIIEWKA